MLTIHHLGHSQSERIVWLCEELGIPYKLELYTRDSVTRLSPPELRALHPLGAAPVIEHDDLMLAESGAIMEYIIAKFGNGRLALPPSHPDFAKYLYWFHFANSNMQPVMSRNMLVHRLNLPDDNPVKVSTRERLDRALGTLETRLSDTTWLAGETFTAADIMIVFTLTTMRLFYPLDLAPWKNILAYLQRVGARPAYQAAMKKGDPDLVPMLT
jgi:glutathione S-transferase